MIDTNRPGQQLSEVESGPFKFIAKGLGLADPKQSAPVDAPSRLLSARAGFSTKDVLTQPKQNPWKPPVELSGPVPRGSLPAMLKLTIAQPRRRVVRAAPVVQQDDEITVAPPLVPTDLRVTFAGGARKPLVARKSIDAIDESLDLPIDLPIDTPVDTLVDTPTDTLVDKLIDTPVDRPIDTPIENAPEDPTTPPEPPPEYSPRAERKPAKCVITAWQVGALTPESQRQIHVEDVADAQPANIERPGHWKGFKSGLRIVTARPRATLRRAVYIFKKMA